MICRVALHERTPGPITSEEARGFRAWIKSRPGFVGWYHAQYSETGRMLSVTVWDSEGSMAAMRNLTPPGGAVGISTERLEMFDVVEEF